MPNHLCHPDDWLYFVESQVNKSLPERLELLPGLRARFGNLLRDEIVSVMLEFDERQYVVAIAAIGDSVINRPIDHYIPAQLLNRPDPFEWQSLLPVAHEWVIALDGVDAAHEFGLFTRHALALIDRMSQQANSWAELESSLEKANNAFTLQSRMAASLAASIAPAIRDKIETSIRSQYQTNPANELADEDCRTEWHELGAMLLNDDHMLLEIGVDQLKSSIYSALSALPESDKLALWFHHNESAFDCLEDRSPEHGFDVLKDSDTFEELVESIASDLKWQMQNDWEETQNELNLRNDEIAVHIQELEAVLDGDYDDEDLEILFNKIDKAYTGLENYGCAERYDKLIGDATDYWTQLNKQRHN